MITDKLLRVRKSRRCQPSDPKETGDELSLANPSQGAQRTYLHHFYVRLGFGDPVFTDGLHKLCGPLISHENEPVSELSGEPTPLREHPSIVSVPVALKTFLRIIFPLQLEELLELRVATFHLLARRVTMVR
jgi:hypothetical protein